MPRKFRSAVVILGLLTVLAGCTISPLGRRTSNFSTAAATTAMETANAYEMVERTHYETEVAALVANYDRDGFQPEKIKPFLSVKDKETRTRILDGLTRYAETLAEVSGDRPLKEIDTQAKALGESLRDLSKSDALAPLGQSAHLSDTEMNIAATALDALGRALVNRRRSRELPGILKEMQEPIETICSLLEADIGDPEKSGLRNQLRNDYATLIRKQTDYITDGKNLTAAERRAAIESLPRLTAAQRDGDKALEATQKALRQLARTHTALVESAAAKDAPAFGTLLSELIDEGKQLHGFYERESARRGETR